MASIKTCVVCCKNKANRPRGMCWTCYYAPGVRETMQLARCVRCGAERSIYTKYRAEICSCCRRALLLLASGSLASEVMADAAMLMAKRLNGQAAQPTAGTPGSMEKLTFLIARADAGLPLWVAGDRMGDLT